MVGRLRAAALGRFLKKVSSKVFFTYFDYRYDISNCLFQAAYEKILEECRCTPYFHWGDLPFDDFCRGKSLKCMNSILGRIGQYNRVDGKPCLAACEDQKNSVSITTSRYYCKMPMKKNFSSVQFLGTSIEKYSPDVRNFAFYTPNYKKPAKAGNAKP